MRTPDASDKDLQKYSEWPTVPENPDLRLALKLALETGKMLRRS